MVAKKVNEIEARFALLKTKPWMKVFFRFRQEKDRSVLLSGPILQEKALSLNDKLGVDPPFTASSGWLTRWIS